MVRTDLEQRLHRLANYIECQLADTFPELLAESRIRCVSLLANTASEFIEALREARDGKEGGEA